MAIRVQRLAFHACLKNNLHNPIDVGLNRPIWKPDNFQSQAIQYLVSLLIIFNLSGVNFTVQFDPQSGFMAVEIDDQSGNYLLPAEMQASETVRPQPLPEDFFSIHLISAQFPGERRLLSAYFLTNDDIFRTLFQ